MTADLRDIVLSYPATHGRPETVRMLNSYKADRPEMYDRWIEVETSPTSDPENVLKETQLDVIDYLREACTCSDMMGAIKGWLLMRRELLGLLRDKPGRKAQ